MLCQIDIKFNTRFQRNIQPKLCACTKRKLHRIRNRKSQISGQGSGYVQHTGNVLHLSIYHKYTGFDIAGVAQQNAIFCTDATQFHQFATQFWKCVKILSHIFIYTNAFNYIVYKKTCDLSVFAMHKNMLCRTLQIHKYIIRIEFYRESMRVHSDSPGWSLRESLDSPPFSLCVKLLTVYESLTGFSQINLAHIFERLDSHTLIKMLALNNAILASFPVVPTVQFGIIEISRKRDSPSFTPPSTKNFPFKRGTVSSSNMFVNFN